MTRAGGDRPTLEQRVKIIRLAPSASLAWIGHTGAGQSTWRVIGRAGARARTQFHRRPGRDEANNPERRAGLVPDRRSGPTHNCHRRKGVSASPTRARGSRPSTPERKLPGPHPRRSAAIGVSIPAARLPVPNGFSDGFCAIDAGSARLVWRAVPRIAISCRIHPGAVKMHKVIDGVRTSARAGNQIKMAAKTI